MPRKKTSIQAQVTQNLMSKLAIGESKHEAKKHGKLTKIYSYTTYHNYKKHCLQFVLWAHVTHGCKTLEQARVYIDEWLQMRIDRNLSAYTIKLDAAALAKLYGCSTTDFIATPPRLRRNIKRSRNPAKRDRHFSEILNQGFVDFCRATGLRQHEIRKLTGNALVCVNGCMCLHVRGKGGKWRDAPIIGPHGDAVIARCQAAGMGLVWAKVPSNVDIHAYRREYAQSMYQSIARDVSALPRVERYDCRAELQGTRWDRKAMLMVSRALGHNRISVIAGNYLA